FGLPLVSASLTLPHVGGWHFSSAQRAPYPPAHAGRRGDAELATRVGWQLAPVERTQPPAVIVAAHAHHSSPLSSSSRSTQMPWCAFRTGRAASVNPPRAKQTYVPPPPCR